MSAPGDLYDRFRAIGHFGSLDGVRFLCIAAVLWHHAPGARDYHFIIPLFSRGHTGVDFFFVLSGFLITTLLLREAVSHGRFSLKGFYWRRALRIIPVYFLVVSLAAFNEIVLDGETDKLALLPYYYLFLSNFLVPEDITFLDVTWSLAMEEQFYLVWPLLLLLLPRNWLLPVLAGLIAVNVVAVMDGFAVLGIHGFAIGDLWIRMSGTTYAPILMGAAVAVILHDRRGFACLRRLVSFRAAPWVCLAALLLVLNILPRTLEGLPNLLVHTLMCLLLCSLVIREDNSMAPVLRWRPIVRIGQISYGVYLYHLFARGVVTATFPALGLENVWIMFAAMFALSVLVSELSFRYFEAHFLRLRHIGPGRRAKAGETVT